jgi:hypothetical protein
LFHLNWSYITQVIHFSSFKTNLENSFPFYFEIPLNQNATCTPLGSPAQHRVADSGVPRPTCHPHRDGLMADLAGGEPLATGSSPSASREEAKSVVPKTRSNELGIELTGMHGGAMALAHGGRPKQATMVANEARASSAR